MGNIKINKEYDIEQVANQIEQLIMFASLIPEQALLDTIESIDNKIGGSVLFMAMGQEIDFDDLERKKTRAEAFLNLIRVLKETSKRIEDEN